MYYKVTNNMNPHTESCPEKKLTFYNKELFSSKNLRLYLINIVHYKTHILDK